MRNSPRVTTLNTVTDYFVSQLAIFTDADTRIKGGQIGDHGINL